MHSVLRSARAQTVLLFLFGLSMGFAILSSLAHGSAEAEADAGQQAPASASPSPAPAVDPSPIATASPTLTVPPDPVDDPGGAVDSVRSAWRDGGWLGVALVGFYLLVLIAKRYVSWLTTGRRAVVVAALVTAIVTAISTFTGQGPTLSWAINALVAGVLLYLRPEPVPTPAPETEPAKEI